MKGKRITVRKRNGSTVRGTVVYEQTDTICVQTDEGYVTDVEREPLRDGSYQAIYGE